MSHAFAFARRGLALSSLSAAAWLLAACGGSPPPVEHAASPPPAAVAAASVPEEPVCVDEKEQRVQCLADADCCPRFVCGKDPELSQAVSYCIFGG